jgi:hypothetical protein
MLSREIKIDKVQIKNMSKRLNLFLVSHIKNAIFALFLVLAGYCFYLWYVYAYNFQWSTEKKVAYISANSKEITIDVKKFNAIIDEKRMRENEYQKNPGTVVDIFRLK